jgi:hypothetical protein
MALATAEFNACAVANRGTLRRNGGESSKRAVGDARPQLSNLASASLSRLHG